MGKKMKSKGRSPRKAHPRGSAGSAPPDSATSDPMEDVEVECGEACGHYSKDSAEVNQVLSGIISSKVAATCEHCREEPPAKRRSGGKKGKQQKKKEGGAKTSESGASDSHLIWLCLDCGRHFCGGAVSDLVPYGHARRHSKQERHAIMVRFDNPSIGWCFSCNATIQVELPPVLAEAGDQKSIGDDKRVEEGGSEPLNFEDGKGYTIIGLSNLGNTCFFNSVMQNLLAIDMLRQYMVKLDSPIGSLTMALKKLFTETNGGANTKGVLTPKNLFGCLCSKAPQFRGYQQQDSHELLRCLLDGLYMEERNAGKTQDSTTDRAAPRSESTVVDNIFGGQLSSTVRCVECGYASIVHEPFLDLSLPVPSKKSTSKKAAPLPPKRKPVLKERNKSRRFQEKESARGSVVIAQGGPEGVTSSVECSESCSPASRLEENHNWDIAQPKRVENIAPETEGSSWMDFLSDATTTSTNFNVSSQTCGSFNFHCPNNGQTFQSENNISVESEADNSLMQMKVSSGSYEENSSCCDASSSCIHDPGVILLPYEEVNITNNAMAVTTSSQSANNISSSENLVKEPSGHAAAGTDSEQAEPELEGFAELFNEPEVTSELVTGNGLAEEMAVTMWTNKSYESSQEEVDNGNALISIESCLVLFTSTELLSDEHAWYCERCSEVLSNDMTTDQTCKKSEALTKPSNSDIIILSVDGDQGTGEKDSSNFQVDCLASTNPRDLSNIETESASAESELLSEKLASGLKSFAIVCKSKELKCKSEEISNEDNIDLPVSMICDEMYKPKIVTGDHEFIDSKPEKDVGYETISAKEGVQIKRQNLPATCTSSAHDIEENVRNSCTNDNPAVDHVRKKSSKPLNQTCARQDRRAKKEEPTKEKVKREATKRILIDKVPPILVLHLKRFSHDARGRLCKLRGHVLFQETLDLRPYLDPRCNVKENCKYRLFGLVEHSGGMASGHYVAYVRSEGNSGKARKGGSSCSWFYASDAHVREVSFAEVLQSEAYILFYEKAPLLLEAS